MPAGQCWPVPDVRLHFVECGSGPFWLAHAVVAGARRPMWGPALRGSGVVPRRRERDHKPVHGCLAVLVPIHDDPTGSDACGGQTGPIRDQVQHPPHRIPLRQQHQRREDNMRPRRRNAAGSTAAGGRPQPHRRPHPDHSPPVPARRHAPARTPVRRRPYVTSTGTPLQRPVSEPLPDRSTQTR
jgi:hypothetical protein